MEKKPKKTKQTGQPKKKGAKAKATQVSAVTFKISGRVIDTTDPQNKRGIAGVRVNMFSLNPIADQPFLKKDAVTLSDGGFDITFDEADLQERFGQRRPDFFFKVWGADNKIIADTRDSVIWKFGSTTPVTIEIVSDGGGSGPTEPQKLEGRILFDHGLPAGGVTVRLYNLEFGGAATKLAEIKTDRQGLYSLTYNPGGKPANLEVRVADTQGKEVSISGTKYNAGKQEVMNLIAPASVQPLAAEYQRLTTDLSKQVGRQGKIGDARENDDRQDLSLLYQATGWDARLIALAATANKLSTETKIPQDALYALFRAGLPTDKEQLAHISSVAVEKALGKAKEAGIVSLNDPQTTAAQQAFNNFAVETRRATVAPGALSNFGELLNTSVLHGDEKGVFENLYLAYADNPDEFWKKAAENVQLQPKIPALQLQGKLAYLTFNNAMLTQKLQQEIGSLDNLAQLVDKGLYRSADWKNRLNAMAGNKESELKKLIPPAYEGETTAARLDTYAADLARKVRISFPTRVVKQMVANDEIDLGDGQRGLFAAAAGDLKASVGTFFTNAEKLGFEMGKVSLSTFVRQNEKQLFQGIAPAQVEITKESVNRLQRLYQITPSDGSFGALTKLGFNSAYDVVAFPENDFVTRFGGYFSSVVDARLIYRKAQQTTTVVYNFFTIAKQMDSAPPVFAISPPPEVKAAAKAELIKHYPTMESLFGSLDFCECEHCRSVLSPAAYLVDLFQFLDRDDLVWNAFLDDWKNKHNGKAYDGPDFQYQKPFDALIEKRPDLPHLPLTCENTNTALPYIDLTNEILEYYVVNNKLEDKAAYDTGEATTPELLAEPQNMLPDAYKNLLDARFPLTLPFDLWLETVRRFFEHYEISLSEVLKVFRLSDELFQPIPPPVNPKPYYRSAIFAESLGFSPVEHGIFTSTDPLATWHLLYGFDDPAKSAAQNQQAALADLKSAKRLSKRLGISYKELTDIVRTGFINPRLDALVTLRKLGVEAEDVFRYKGHAQYPAFTADERMAFEKLFDDLTKKFNPSGAPDGFNAKTWLDIAWQNGDFNQILVLADPNTGCNFDLTILRYADGSAAEAFVFLKINLFVRLWKKLGWTMEETDRALLTFLPEDLQTLIAVNIGERLKTALLYLAHLKTLTEKLKVGKNSRPKLLTIWANLPTTGKNPLYAQLFLTPSVLKNDPVFDHPLGNYLLYFDNTSGQYKPFYWDSTKAEDVKTGNVPLKSHLLALQGALNLTADEIGHILSLDTAALSLDNVSLLYRYGLLAKALKLPVKDLLALKALAGLDPFKPLKHTPITIIDDDHPFSQTLRFVEIAEKVKESGFKIEDLDYLLRHRFDPVGKYRPNAESLLALVKKLAVELRRIRAEHAIPSDPASLTDDTLRQKLALVLPPDVAGSFLGMWTGTAEYEAIKENVPPANKLDPTDFIGEPAVQVSYNEISLQQRLVFRGVLLDAKKTQLITANPSPVLAELLNKAQKQAKEFFEKNFVNVEPPFLTTGDFDLLFGPIPNNLTEEQKQDRARTKRKKLAEAFLPYLQQKLARQLVVQTLATGLAAEPSLAETLLTNAALLTDPTQAGKPLLDAFTAADVRGVSVAFYDSADLTGNPSKTATVATADTAIKEGSNPVKPATARSGRFEGYLEVPAAGAYRFFAVCGKKDAEAELRFAHLADPLLRGKAVNDGDEISQFTELKPGVPYRFTLEARNLGTGDLRLLVRGDNLPKDAVGQLTLYPETVVERLRRAYILLAKALQLIAGFGLNEREVRYLFTHPADFPELNLSKLPTREADDSPAGAEALFRQFTRLADYGRLKREIAGGSDNLISVFENARRTQRDITDTEKAKTTHFEPFAQLARREAAAVRAAAESLGYAITTTPDGNGLRVETPDMAQEKGIQRLWEVLQVVEKLGVPVEAVVRWTAIINSAKTPNDRFAIARDLKNTVKARYEQENWQRIAQSIFDKLRGRQRDALVAYIMHKQDFERIEQLFEYFLIDPGMEPVVQTSRLRLAISSLQLFIQRCLLNLEPRVHPSAINAAHWQWMKRYRVWEANRKIFLFPENWLEPEFRDDKTHLFQELEGTLLQGDISNDLAEDAFFRYLKRLEELARLEIVTVYCEEKPLDPASNTLHVIGRTYNEPHKYFYRRYAHQMWTPWEPVEAEIEGDHVAAVIWRERLHLFWVTFMVKARPRPAPAPAASSEPGLAGVKLNDLIRKVSENTPLNDVEVQLNWSEFFQGEWTTRESSGFGNPLRIENVGMNFNSRSVFIHASKEYEDGEERAVKINLSGPINGAFRVVSKNSPPSIDSPATLLAFEPYSYNKQASQYTGSDALNVSFHNQVKTETGKLPEFTWKTEAILGQGGKYFLSNCSGLSALDAEMVGALMMLYFGGTLPAGLSRQEILSRYRQAELKSMTSPVFYQDSLHTFFIEPTLVETTVTQWDDWIIPPVIGTVVLDLDDYWKGFNLIYEVPTFKVPPIDQFDPRVNPIDPRARYQPRVAKDWLTGTGTGFQFDGNLIGKEGRVGLVGASTLGNVGVGVSFPGGGLTAGGIAVGPGLGGLTGGGLSLPGNRLNVIGGGGLNPALADALRSERNPEAISGDDLIGDTQN